MNKTCFKINNKYYVPEGDSVPHYNLLLRINKKLNSNYEMSDNCIPGWIFEIKDGLQFENGFTWTKLDNINKSDIVEVPLISEEGQMKTWNKTLSFSERLRKCFSNSSELDKLGFIKGFKDTSINFPYRYRNQVLYTRNLDNSVEYLFTENYYSVLALAQEERKINPNIKIGHIVLDKVPYTLMTCEKAGDLSKVIPKDVAIKIIKLWDKNKKLHDLEGFVDSEEDGNEFDRLLESCGLNDDKYAEYSAPEIVEACRSIINN